MIGWIWTRLLSGNHGVRTARQWLNHVLPTVLVLLRNDLRTLSAVEHSFFVAVDFSR